MSLSVATILLFVQVVLVAQDLKSFRATNEKWGYKDSEGKEVIPAKFLYAKDFEEGLAKVEAKKNRYGYIDPTGKLVIPAKFSAAGDFKDGIAWVRLGDKEGFIDKTGNAVIPIAYDEVENFHEDLASVKLGGKWGFIDKSGKEVIPFTFQSVGSFHEGLAHAELNAKYGFIDRSGKEVIPFTFDDAGDFYEGLAKVRRGGYMSGLWGYIDKKGEVVIDYQFEKADDFEGGKAKVERNGLKFYIDARGRDEKQIEEAKRLAEQQDIEQKARAIAKHRKEKGQTLEFYNKLANAVRNNDLQAARQAAIDALVITGFKEKAGKEMNLYNPDPHREGENCLVYSSNEGFGLSDRVPFVIEKFESAGGSIQVYRNMNQEEVNATRRELRMPEAEKAGWKFLGVNGLWEFWENNGIRFTFPARDIGSGGDTNISKMPLKK